MNPFFPTGRGPCLVRAEGRSKFHGPAQAAIAELDGKDLDGRALKVNEAQERQPRGGGGGGRGGDRW